MPNPTPPTHPGTGGRATTVGVMGGAGDIDSPDRMARAHDLGRAIAASGCVLVTGACPGLPLAAACGAKEAGGVVVGVSPAANLTEHVGRYGSPTAFHDVLVYTGSGLMGREVINVRTSDVVVIVGGRSGTLGELAIAYDEGKPIGVLTGMGGVGDMARAILAVCAKDTGSEVVYDDDPARLVRKLLRLRAAVPPSAAGWPGAPPGEGGRSAAAVTDPVCGMRILPSAAVAERRWEGRRYSFCSTGCANLFDAGPAGFLSKPEPQVGPSRRPRSKKGGKR